MPAISASASTRSGSSKCARIQVIACLTCDSRLSSRGDLAQHAALRTVQQPVEDFALEHRREHRDVLGRVEQGQQPDPGVEQLRGHRADPEARGLSVAAGPGHR